MPPIDHAAALVEYTRRFAGTVAPGAPETPVPTCPGWSLTQLSRHVGRGTLWATTMIRDRATEALDPRQVPGGKPPEGGLVPWLEQGPVALFDAIAATGPDEPVWTFVGPRPAQWWVRRRLHDVTVHLGDAALALGVPFDIEPAVAADGVSEFLDLAVHKGTPPLSLHLHAHDGAGEWLVVSDGDGARWDHSHAKADVAVRGPVADLLLAVAGRPESDALDVVGDRAAWSAWLAATRF
ncbi:maleylpyruvate isomerase family mycothiol-dependent enzyme [Actinokineospora pegani]|uniref:maleylpyruvate isomerase family mycothiol-dependent enzyme n=1 Tax=Actinokineospora pegani TaxID=2654637 RepID=UPI001F3C9F67|nr:maleylpyruvate isomerase family mycothiol-dependent enzyme [Actinokineospora pegani]